MVRRLALIALLGLWLTSGWAAQYGGEGGYGGAHLQFSGRVIVSGGSCQQLTQNLIRCQVPAGTQGTVQLKATVSPSTYSVQINAAAPLPYWASFQPVSWPGTAQTTCTFSPPADAAGQTFQLVFRASTVYGVYVDLTLVLDVVAAQPPSGPEYPQPGYFTDEEGRFTVPVEELPDTTVTGVLTQCTVRPLSGVPVEVTLLPKSGRLSISSLGDVGAVRVSTPYGEATVTDFNLLSSMDMEGRVSRTIAVGTVCIRPSGPTPPPVTPTEPIRGTTDEEGKFSLPLPGYPGTTVSGRLTECGQRPLPGQDFSLTPVWEGEQLAGFTVAVPGYEPVTVTEFGRISLFGLTSYLLGDVCLPPTPGHGDTTISDCNEDCQNRGIYPWQDIEGCQAVCGFCDLGVNVVTGKLIHQRVDISIPGFGPPLEIIFTYNSGSCFSGRYGHGWQMNYNVRYIIKNGKDIIIVREDDRRDTFVRQADGSFEPPPGVYDSLVEYEPGKYVLILKDGTKYWFESPDHHYVTRIEDLNGNELIFKYNAAKQLTAVTDASSRRLTFTYVHNKLVEVTDPAGRKVRYQYDNNDNLTGVIDPVGDITEYSYDDNHNLIAVTDARGNTRTIKYDADQKVEEIRTGCCGVKRFFFSSGSTVVIDANGNVTTYTYDEEGRVIAIEDAFGNTTTRTWDDNHNLTSETDANGHTTRYIYDSKGNVIREIDASGNVTEYTYDPRFNKVTSMTDALGRRTSYIYDDHGNLLVEIDPLRNTTTYTYDTRGLMTSETDARGNTTAYEYDGYGNLIRVTDPLGYSTTYTYDVIGNQLSETDANGNTTRYEYDKLNRLTKVTDPLGYTTTYEYDPVGNLIAETDANGNTTHYEYDEENWLIRIIDPLGGVTSYEYDPVGNKIAETDANGNTTHYKYDKLNRLIKVTDPLGYTTTYEYDPVGNLIAETDANGHTTRYEYDPLNRLVRRIDALEYTTTYEYDAVGNKIAEIDPNGKVTYYEYDNLDRLTKIIRKVGDTSPIVDEDDVVTQYEYDEVGNRIAVIDPLGNRTEYEYNERNELIRETNPEGETTSYTYDPAGNKKTETRPNGNVITYEYDERGQLISVSDLIGPVMSYTYDGVGNRLTETDANGHITTYEYDALNRLIRVTDPMGESTTYTYDEVGNLLTVTDRNGNTTAYTYDAVGRRTSVTDALGNVTTYEYDPVGNLIRITDANGNSTAYEYDALNRLIRQTYADNTTREFSYDGVGNLITRRDQLGNLTTYEYDDLYNLTKRDYPGDNDDRFTYDKARRMLTARNLHSTITFTYDKVGRVIRTTQNGYTISYEYDIPNNRRIITYPSGKVVTETRDKRDRLVKVEELGVGIIARYVYDAADRLLSKTHGNGVVTAYSYNPNDWVTSLTHTRGEILIAGFGYDYDKEGNRKYAENLLPFDPEKEYTHSEKYEYDAIYRLVDFKTGQLVAGDIPSPIKTRTWTLDPVGNWIQFTIDGVTYQNTPNQMNEYDDPSTDGPPPVPDDDGIPDDFKDSVATPEPDGFNSAHDKNGNLVDDGVNIYEYDYENRLIRVIRKSDGAILGEYRYDPLNRRIEKDVEGVTTIYLYDEWRVIEERIGGSVAAEYVYGDWIDEVLTMERGGQRFYYHVNALGSVIALTDALGNVVERYAYDAYGKVSIMDGVGTPLPNSAIGNTYLFTGRRLDEETELYYYRARYYSTERGRFLQRDPVGYVDGMHLYKYVGGNPSNLIDPLGIWIWKTEIWDYNWWNEHLVDFSVNWDIQRVRDCEIEPINVEGRVTNNEGTLRVAFANITSLKIKCPRRGGKDCCGFLIWWNVIIHGPTSEHKSISKVTTKVAANAQGEAGFSGVVRGVPAGVKGQAAGQIIYVSQNISSQDISKTPSATYYVKIKCCPFTTGQCPKSKCEKVEEDRVENWRIDLVGRTDWIAESTSHLEPKSGISFDIRLVAGRR